MTTVGRALGPGPCSLLFVVGALVVNAVPAAAVIMLLVHAVGGSLPYRAALPLGVLASLLPLLFCAAAARTGRRSPGLAEDAAAGGS